MEKLTFAEYLNILKVGLSNELTNKEQVLEMILNNDLYLNSGQVSDKMYKDANECLIDGLKYL
jgi:hypothetical protein